MSNESDELIFDVFDVINHKPVLKYKMTVMDGIIMSINNEDEITGVRKIIKEDIIEELFILELTKIEKLGIKGELTYKFQIKKYGKEYLYLNLTDIDLINLGFIEPKQVVGKSEKFWIWIKKFHKTILWVLAGILLVLSTNKAIFENLDILKKYLNPKESNQTINKQNIDDNTVSKNDSLSKN